MKKILPLLVLVLLLLLTAIYIFIPAKLTVTTSRKVECTSNGLDSCLHKPDQWMRWWPGARPVKKVDSDWVHEGVRFRLNQALTDGAAISISSGNKQWASRLQIIPAGRDSIAVEWKLVIEAGNDPVSRFRDYRLSTQVKKAMEEVADSLCAYASQTKNIYGFPVQRTTFREIFLASTRFTTSHPPLVSDIYTAIGKIRDFIRQNGAQEKYYPMMDTQQIDSTHYETMVAISIDRKLPASGDFFISQMVPMEGRFLETQVTGGPGSIRQAHAAVLRYMFDHSLSAPARPFEILVTDRMTVSDTLRWQTTIFYPSM